MRIENIRYPQILGSLVIYTPSSSLARKVHDIVIDCKHAASLGTVFFENGEEIDWVDISFEAMRHAPLR